MGLLVNVYRNSILGDCTNNGISKRYNTFCVTNVEGPFSPNENTPELLLEVGVFNSIKLVLPNTNGKHYMFGGNYAGTSDSRFNRAIEELVGYNVDIVKIFDRTE